MTASVRAGAVALALLLLAPAVASGQAATIVINNVNAPGVGFNDPTPRAPLPTNPGTTLGQQRLIVFERAAILHGQLIQSPVPIIVNAQFISQTCGPTSGVLGSAGTQSASRDFPGAPVAGTWYHAALANSLAETDLNPGVHDINANFNLNLDSDPNCLGGVGWYYGLDHNEAGQVDLLAVVEHELAHGLGFSNFVNLSTGAFFQDFPDTYSRLIFDNSTGQLWPQMNNAGRVASAINDPFVVWSGAAVAARAGSVLGIVPVVTVNSPGPIAGDYEAQEAAYGPSVSAGSVTGSVVLVDDGSGLPNEGCGPLINGPAVNGNIALVDRGTCTFVTKSANAQAAGATGVLIANNAATGLPPMGGSDPGATIPSLGITQALGNSIKANLPAPGVNVTLQDDPLGTLAGTNGGSLRLNAPDPLALGSSISHWTPAASPNLLMEPAINSDLTDDIDLTLDLFIDVGWQTPIFANGFESGDTSSWSLAVP